MPGNLQSIERAAAVVRLLGTGSEPQPLQTISQMLNLPRSTTHGIVRTLVMVGWVTQDAATRRYRLAPAMSGWNPQPLDVNELRSRAMNWVDTLAARSRLDCRLLVLSPGSGPSGSGPGSGPGSGSAKQLGVGLVAHHVIRPDSRALVPDVGDSVPLHATSGGKVLLAFDPRAGRLAETIPLEPLAFRTLVVRAHLLAELTSVRLMAYAVEREEWRSGFGSLAAPVRSHGGIAIAALMVGGRVDDIFSTSGTPLPGVLTSLQQSASAVTQAICAERG